MGIFKDKWAENLMRSKKEQASEPSEGLGDTVKKITNAMGIKPCDECEERRKSLNKKFPFKRKNK